MIATTVSHYPKVGDAPGQQRLRQAIAKLDRGEIDAQGLSQVADEVTVEVLREQEGAGLDLVTDGQVRWQDPVTYICSRLQGFQIGGLLRWFESNTYYRQPVAVEKVRWTQPILVDDLKFAREHAQKPVKAVVTGPYTLATLSLTRAHSSHREFVLELARELNRELRALAAEQPEWIQVDEPAIARNASVEYPRDFETFTEAMHLLTDGVPGNLSLYVYHGSAEDVPGLTALPFGLFGFDLIQGVASWEVLRTWPADKAVGLGIVDARNVKLEEPDRLAQVAAVTARNTRAADVHVNPSCGLEFLPRETARRKLELVAHAAHAAEVRA